jgi:transcriptional regulator with XRE-family HTH domain
MPPELFLIADAEELEALTDVRADTWRRWLSGAVHPGLHLARQAAEAMGYSVDTFLDLLRRRLQQSSLLEEQHAQIADLIGQRRALLAHTVETSS